MKGSSAALSRPTQLLGVSERSTLSPDTSANFFILNEDSTFDRRVTPRGVTDFA